MTISMRLRQRGINMLQKSVYSLPNLIRELENYRWEQSRIRVKSPRLAYISQPLAAQFSLGNCSLNMTQIQSLVNEYLQMLSYKFSFNSFRVLLVLLLIAYFLLRLFVHVQGGHGVLPISTGFNCGRITEQGTCTHVEMSVQMRS